MPFLNLVLTPSGKVSPCCWNQDVDLGNIKDSDLLSIWNGEKMQALRREFLTGEAVTCREKIRHLGCNAYLNDLEDRVVRTEIQDAPPRRLDLRLNGKCNLECQMCSVWTEPNGLYDVVGFWDQAREKIFPHLLEMDVLGGEPFIQKDTYRLIREVTQVNSVCRWGFVTNGQWKFGDYVKDHLDRINIRFFQVSIDSLDPQTYAQIRIKGHLDRVLETFERIHAYRDERAYWLRPFALSISMAVQQNNWKEMPAFVQFARDKRVKPILQFVYPPVTHSLYRESREVRQEILTELGKWATEFSDPWVFSPITMAIRDSLGVEDPLEFGSGVRPETAL